MITMTTPATTPTSPSSQSSLASAMAGNADGVLKRKTYAELRAEATKFNILEFTISNIYTTKRFDKKALSDEDFSTFVFDILKIDPKLCLQFDYFPGQINMKFIKVKSELQTKPLVSEDPYTFQDFHIKVSSSSWSV